MSQICKTGFTIVGAVGAMLVASACDSERSSNPLSPQIAGPLAGVTITAAMSTQPIDGQLIPVASQPVSLIFANATSDSVRPFTYEIQVATDGAFVQMLLEGQGIEPTPDGQVTYQIPVTLAPEQMYYWRVRALDGANTGPYAATSTFEMYTPLVIPAPTVLGPTGGGLLPDNNPTFAVQNADITGPAQTIQYRFELSTQADFATTSAVFTVAQGAGPTTRVSPAPLAFDQLFFWRVRISAQSRVGEVEGPWSATASFRTPVEPVSIGVPTPFSPVNGATTPSVRPTLVVTNGVVTGAAGAVTYRFEVDEGTSFGNPAAVVVVPRSGSPTTAATLAANLEAGRVYFWRVRGSDGAITSAWSAPQQFRTPVGAPPPPPPGPGPGPGGRTPDPPPGQQLPLPNEQGIIFAIAAANPGAIANSCIDEGGSWLFMDLAVAALRATDTRWGYNCKRGDCGDPSVDVVNYFYGIGSEAASQGSTEVYLIDIIGAVCPGGNQGPSWTDQTQATADAGAIGRWIYPRP